MSKIGSGAGIRAYQTPYIALRHFLIPPSRFMRHLNPCRTRGH
ncbi:hypothetical protein [Xylella fastidiosa]|nr:hypothetical protein [Xylella fastidiosa]